MQEEKQEYDLNVNNYQMYLLTHQLQCGIILDSGKIVYLQDGTKNQIFTCKCQYCIFKLKVIILPNQKVEFIVIRPHTCFVLPIEQRIVLKYHHIYPQQIIKFLRIVQLQLTDDSIRQILCNLIVTAINQFDIINTLNETCCQFIVPKDYQIQSTEFYSQFAPDYNSISQRAQKARKQNLILTNEQPKLIDTATWTQKQIDTYIFTIMSQI